MIHRRFLAAAQPAAVKRAIKQVDRVSAWLEAIQIAGFSGPRPTACSRAVSRFAGGLEIGCGRRETRNAYLARLTGLSGKWTICLKVRE